MRSDLKRKAIIWVRDVTIDEDRCRIWRRAGFRVTVSGRKMVISLLRPAGAFFIAPTL